MRARMVCVSTRAGLEEHLGATPPPATIVFRRVGAGAMEESEDEECGHAGLGNGEVSEEEVSEEERYDDYFDDEGEVSEDDETKVFDGRGLAAGAAAEGDLAAGLVARHLRRRRTGGASPKRLAVQTNGEADAEPRGEAQSAHAPSRGDDEHSGDGPGRAQKAERKWREGRKGWQGRKGRAGIGASG